MNATCQRIRDRLGEAGAAALRDDADARQHVEGCEHCFALLETVAELERGLAALPGHDASDAAVERLLARVAAEPSRSDAAGEETEKPRRRFVVWPSPRRMLALSAAVGALTVATLVAVASSQMRARVVTPQNTDYDEPGAVDEHERLLLQSTPPPTTLPPEGFGDRAAGGAGARKDGRLSEEQRKNLQALGYLGPDDAPAEPEADASGRLRDLTAEAPAVRAGRKSQANEDEEFAFSAPVEVPEEVVPAENLDAAMAGGVEGGVEGGVPGGIAGGLPGGVVGGAVGELEKKEVAQDRLEPNAPASEGEDAADGKIATGLSVDLPAPADRQGILRFEGDDAPEPVERVEPRFPQEAVAASLEVHVGVSLRVGTDGAVTDARSTGATVLGDWDGGNEPLVRAVLEAVRRWRYAPQQVDGRAVPFAVSLTLRFDLGARPDATSPSTSSDASASDERPSGGTPEARAFLAERGRTRGLAFQPASGYWANTWVPGDPVLRLLQLRLAGAAPLTGPDGRPLALHAASHPPRRPFDPPVGAGVGLYVQSDRAALDGEARILVEVGLQATRHAGGRRPTLDLALVLDLRGALAVEDAARLRALVLALAHARQGGDRFRLVVAGRGPLADVAPEDFRYGALAVGLDRLLGEATAGAGDAGALPAALARAIAAVAEPAPGAAAAVVVATPGSLAPLSPLTSLAHRGAVQAAVTTSVVGVGARVERDELDRLALAGQGDRRLLDRREEAEALVARQLAGAGRAVARALRLRIRLAPGVRLVDVVGSERLDARRADRVREAERSLDQRLAREMGIESDRGEDEDGIQIVIPTFAAGATHSILLDVVAPGPGPIADVTLRYKDVAFLRNGTARASLALPRGHRAPGPLENSVVSLLLARRLEDDLEAAGDELGRGDVAGARERLRRAVELRAGLPAVWPALAGDPALRADLAMLQEYRTALAAPRLAPQRRQDLSRSLRYAARLKRLPPPAPLAGVP